MGIEDLKEKLGKLNYKVKAGAANRGYNPVSSIDFKQLDLKVAEKNISSALNEFTDGSSWKCFGDMRKALLEIMKVLR
jgi:hypothetical protein